MSNCFPQTSVIWRLFKFGWEVWNILILWHLHLSVNRLWVAGSVLEAVGVCRWAEHHAYFQLCFPGNDSRARQGMCNRILAVCAQTLCGHTPPQGAVFPVQWYWCVWGCLGLTGSLWCFVNEISLVNWLTNYYILSYPWMQAAPVDLLKALKFKPVSWTWFHFGQWMAIWTDICINWLLWKVLYVSIIHGC